MMPIGHPSKTMLLERNLASLPPSSGRDRPRGIVRRIVPAVFLGLVLSVLLLTPFSPAAADDDPRIELVQLQLAGRDSEALERVDALLDTDHPPGLDYLRGRLLLRLGDRAAAFEAFAAAMRSSPELAAHSRYRLAIEQERLGHPAVAAGLVATLLRSDPPGSLVGPAMLLLGRAIEAGGDCRVLRDLESLRLRSRERRELELAVAECRRRRGDTEAARRSFVALLDDEHRDVVARRAAEKLVEEGAKDDVKDDLEDNLDDVHRLIGLAFHQHREFDIALEHLERALADEGVERLDAKRRFELRYAHARSLFWLGRYREAAAAFARLAEVTSERQQKAQVLFQEGRSYELSGDFQEAEKRFRRVVAADPRGSWGAAGRIAELRLAWRRGDEEAALENLAGLLARNHRSLAARALLYLASSDLVSGRADRAGGWLDRAASLGRVATRELEYWRGRRAELLGEAGEAVTHYAAVLADDADHPFAAGARRRLAQPVLGPAVTAAVRQGTTSDDTDALVTAYLLLDRDDPARRELRRRLESRFAEKASAATYLGLETVPVSAWPLWSDALDEPEESLLALGLFDEGGAFVLRHFPVARPDLAYTGSVALAYTGETKRALYIAEILSHRVPKSLPRPFWPQGLKELLHPFPERQRIVSEARRRKIDPHLLAALIREESRFDPNAFSTAAARGLTQFVFPTARQIATEFDLGKLVPADLERPEIAIALGAAYLRRLSDDFDGSLPEIVAAYNAGEPQAALWRKYCFSDEPEEYLTKIAFRETRGYLAKVLTSRSHYAALYPLL